MDDTPILEIKIEPDFTELDEGLKQRQHAASSGATFGNEGRGGTAGIPNFGATTRLPDIADRMAASFERAAQAAAKFAVTSHYSTGGGDARDPVTGRFVAPGQFYNTNWSALTHTPAGLGYGAGWLPPTTNPSVGMGYGGGWLPPRYGPFASVPQPNNSAGMGYGPGWLPSSPGVGMGHGNGWLPSTPGMGMGHGRGWLVNSSSGLGYGAGGAGPGSSDSANAYWSPGALSGFGGGGGSPPVGLGYGAGGTGPGDGFSPFQVSGSDTGFQGGDSGSHGEASELGKRYRRYKDYLISKQPSFRKWATSPGQFTRTAFVSGMFGAFEVAHAHRAISHAQTAALVAQDQSGQMDADLSGIEGATSGIFGSVVGLAADLTGAGPSQLRQIVEFEKSRRASIQNTTTMSVALTGAAATRKASWFGDTATTIAKANQTAADSEEAIKFKREGLTSKLSEMVKQRDSVEEAGKKYGWIQSTRDELSGLNTNISATSAEIGQLNRSSAENKAQRDMTIALANRDSDYQKQVISGEASVAAAFVGSARTTFFGRASVEAEARRQETISRLALQTSQANEISQATAKDAGLVPGLQVKHSNEMAEFDRRIVENRAERAGAQYRQSSSIQMAALGETIASNLTTQFRPMEAQQAQLRAQRYIRWMNADPQDKAYEWQAGTAAMEAAQAQEERGRGVQLANVQGSISSHQSLIQHLPLQARLDSLSASRQAALMSVPNDNPALRDATNKDFDLQVQFTKQQYKEERYLATMRLSREEKESGILANAYGPGANLKRIQAAVMGVGGSAEERAEARLLHDKSDIANADRERRIGINQLKGMQANYLEGFTAQEGNRFTAFSGGLSASPGEVLKSIDDGIKQLVAKIGLVNVAVD